MYRLIACIALAAVLPAQPRRIVSTAPSVTETLFALGLGDRVVGISQHCHYPPETATRPRVGTYLTPNIEAIVGLHPDLVIVQTTPSPAAAQLERMQLNVLSVEHATFPSLWPEFKKLPTAVAFPIAARS